MPFPILGAGPNEEKQIDGIFQDLSFPAGAGSTHQTIKVTAGVEAHAQSFP